MERLSSVMLSVAMHTSMFVCRSLEIYKLRYTDTTKLEVWLIFWTGLTGMLQILAASKIRAVGRNDKPRCVAFTCKTCNSDRLDLID